jgi:hypothetical protein
MTGVRAGVALGAAVVLGLLMIVLSDSQQRLAGTNTRVQASGGTLRFAAGKRRCQRQDAPAGAASVRFYAQPFVLTGGPLDVTLFEGGRLLTKGVVLVARADVPAVAKLDRPLKREVPGLRLCIANSGLTPIDLRGDRTSPADTFINTGGQGTPDDVRVDFLRPGSESWWDVAPAVARRFGLEKASFFGSWTMWAVFVLIALNGIGALFLLARESRPR